MRRTLALLALGCHVDVECRDVEAWALLDAHYAALRGPRGGAALRYTVGRCPESSAFFLACERHVGPRGCTCL